MSLTGREHAASPMARLRARRTDELLVQLEQAARDTSEVLGLLERVVHAHPHSGELIQETRDRDDAVDRATRELLRALHGRYVVPLEPDDLRSLVNTLSSLSHGALQIAERLTIFRLLAPREHARRLSHLLVDAGAVVDDATRGIAAGHRPTDHAPRLRNFARTGNELVRDGLGDLYADGSEAALLVAWTDLYEHFTAMLATLATIADTFDAINPNPQP